MNLSKSVQLILEDGTVFKGKSFGAEKPSAGEVVFSTAMVGYPESLTDPSYMGQILTITYPIVGNYGVPANTTVNGVSEFFESEKIHVNGLIVSDYSDEYSHWNAKKSLGEWLKENDVPGIYDIDTRALTKHLREKGSMKGKIVYDNANEIDFLDIENDNLVAKSSCTEIIEYGSGDKTVVLVDCGVKHNIIRCLLKRNIKLVRVPWDYDFNTMEWDGLFISNGPGNPNHCDKTVENIKKAMERNKPICGICMGNQLLSKAAGASVYKLKYGHRSHNQPVKIVDGTRCYITSQNHGYAVDENSLGKDWEPLFVNLNDGTNEGIRHKTKPFFSAQFHPEAASGPTDTDFIFDMFIEKL